MFSLEITKPEVVEKTYDFADDDFDLNDPRWRRGVFAEDGHDPEIYGSVRRRSSVRLGRTKDTRVQEARTSLLRRIGSKDREVEDV